MRDQLRPLGPPQIQDNQQFSGRENRYDTVRSAPTLVGAAEELLKQSREISDIVTGLAVSLDPAVLPLPDAKTSPVTNTPQSMAPVTRIVEASRVLSAVASILRGLRASVGDPL